MAKRLRPIVLEALPDLDEAGFAENLQVPAQVAVGQGAQILQIVEDQARRMRRQRGDDAQARFLMNHAVEPFIGKPARRTVDRFFLTHRYCAPESSTGWRPIRAAPRRTARP